MSTNKGDDLQKLLIKWNYLLLKWKGQQNIFEHYQAILTQRQPWTTFIYWINQKNWNWDQIFFWRAALINHGPGEFLDGALVALILKAIVYEALLKYDTI